MKISTTTLQKCVLINYFHIFFFFCLSHKTRYVIITLKNKKANLSYL